MMMERLPSARTASPSGRPPRDRPAISPRARAVAAWSCTVLLSAFTVGLVADVPSAQSVRPWIPPAADSLQRWASEARVLFQTNTGDSVGGANFRAYERVGLMGRRLVRSLGRTGIVQAHAVKGLIDSLGLHVDVAMDPRLPEFVLLMVRNPYRITAHSVGFLYWYRGDDLRMQGAVFFGGHRPSMRVWWTGYRDQPYSLGVIDYERSTAGRARLTLFRMNPAGTAWMVSQSPDQGPDLSGASDVTWGDLNGDGRPELVAWVRVDNDTLFEACNSCPGILQEHIYTESRGGMQLYDVRLLPSPYSTFTLFVRLLSEGNRNAAARLLRDPSKLDEAVAAGWGLRGRAGTWKLEYTEEDPWPRWLALLHHGPRGDQRYIVHFELKEGRWIIRDWLKPRPPGVRAAPSDSGALPRGGSSPASSPPAPPTPGAPGPRRNP